MDDTGYFESFYSIFDSNQLIQFKYLPSAIDLNSQLEQLPSAQRLAWFSKSFYSVSLKLDKPNLEQVVEPSRYAANVNPT